MKSKPLLPVYLLRGFMAHRCLQVAASLSFATLFALVPLLTLVWAMLSLFPAMFDPWAAFRAFAIDNLLPDASGRVVADALLQFTGKARRLTVIGLLLFGLTAIVLLHTLERELNAFWHVRSARPVWRRGILYAALLTLGPLLVGASLLLTTYLLGLSQGWAHEAPEMRPLLLEVVPFLLVALAFSLFYALLPNARVRYWHAGAGGLLAAALFELFKAGFTAYLKAVPTYRIVYGAFAGVPIFLLWVYLSWIAVLLGALFASAFARR